MKDGNRQKGASIFFSDKFWTEDECLYKSDNGDLVIVKLVGKNLSVIVSNVYAAKTLSWGFWTIFFPLVPIQE